MSGKSRIQQKFLTKGVPKLSNKSDPKAPASVPGASAKPEHFVAASALQCAFLRPSEMGMTKPDPETASEREMCLYLLQKSEQTVANERKFDEANNKTRMAFMSMAFSISVAYLVERLFINVVGSLMYSEHNLTELNMWQKYTVQVLWFAIVCGSFPLTEVCLQGVSGEGSKSRTLVEDVLILWKASSRTMVLWSFKDVCLKSNGVLAQQWLRDGDDGEPSSLALYWYNTYSSDNVEDCFRYLGINCLVILGALVFSVSVSAVIKHCLHKFSFADKWIQDSPFILGVGMATSRVLGTGWYWFPWDAISTHNKEIRAFSVYATAVRIVLCILNTVIPIFLMRKHEKYKRHIKSTVGNVIPVTTWLFSYAMELFVRSARLMVIESVTLLRWVQGTSILLCVSVVPAHV